MNDMDCFAPDEPHKKEYVDAILVMMEHRDKDVSLFNSAIELDYNDNGYEFLYDFAMAVTEANKAEFRIFDRPPTMNG